MIADGFFRKPNLHIFFFNKCVKNFLKSRIVEKFVKGGKVKLWKI